MPENERDSAGRGRTYLLAGFLLAVLAVYAAVLFQTQYIKGDDYLDASIRTITKTEIVQASRGILTDRDGRALVSNRQTYNLTFSAAALDEDEINAAILRLLQLLRSQGLTWADRLPVSAEAPYVYTDNTATTSFNKFLQEKMELVSPSLKSEDLTGALLTEAGLTAPDLIERMREVYAIPSTWSDGDARAVLGVRYELTVREVMNTTEYYMVEDIDSALIALLNDGGYAGASVVSVSVREYQTDYAAHILGTVGPLQSEDLDDPRYEDYPMNSVIGRSGAESAFEEYLHGVNGRRVVSTNTEGKITGVYYDKQPVPGSTVELTIDLPFQQAVEDALAATIAPMNAEDGKTTRGGAAAVIGVGTGEVLALASYPTYSLTDYNANFTTYRDDPGKPFLNRATSGLYPPGSTLKPLTAIAALVSDVTTVSERINDTGRWIYPGTTNDGAWCWNHAGHGRLNVTGAITNSCNYYFAEMGYRMGMDTLREYFTAFGLGESTGIEIGDSAGKLPENPQGEDQAPWAAFGQSNQLYTPIQLANYIATLVSGGEHYQTHLLKTVKSYDDTEVLTVGAQDPVNTIDIDPAYLDAVKQGMYDLTHGGSLTSYFSRCVVDAAAKTGTAQLGAGVTNNGVFVCFAPYDDPQIAVALVIEEGGAGAALASTAVDIINAYFTAAETERTVTGENTLLP